MTQNQPSLPYLEDSVTFSNGIIYRSKYKNNKHETNHPKVSLDNNKAYYALAQDTKLPDMSTEIVLSQEQAEKAYQEMHECLFGRSVDILPGLGSSNDKVSYNSYHLYEDYYPDTVIVFMLKNAVVSCSGPIKLFKSSSVIPYLLISSIDVHNMRNSLSWANVECEGVYGATMYELKSGTDFAKSLDPIQPKEELRAKYVKAYDGKELPAIILDSMFTSKMLDLVSGETDHGDMYDMPLLPEIHSIYTDCIELDMNPNAKRRLEALQFLYSIIQEGTKPGEWTVTIDEQ